MHTSRFQLGLIACSSLALGIALSSSEAVGYPASAVSMATGYLVMHGGRRALKDHERRCARTACRFPTAAAAGLTPLPATSGGDPIPLGVVNAASTGDASFRRGARTEL